MAFDANTHYYSAIIMIMQSPLTIILSLGQLVERPQVRA